MELKERVAKAIREVTGFPKEGVNFKDITPILLDAQLTADITASLVKYASARRPDMICAVESRGFLFGSILAHQLGIPLVMIRKEGKLPGKTISTAYQLEYGEGVLEMQEADIKPNSRVLIHDDLLATGGTANAASDLVRRAGGKVVGFSFLVYMSEKEGVQSLKPSGSYVNYLMRY